MDKAEAATSLDRAVPQEVGRESTHWCIGDEMALAELAAMGIAILSLPEPRIAGSLRHDWSAVESLIVEYG